MPDDIGKRLLGHTVQGETDLGRELLVEAARLEFNQALREKLPAMARLYTEELMATHDANEGIASFLEKRKPAWKDS